jgi:hypothetical protein
MHAAGRQPGVGLLSVPAFFIFTAEKITWKLLIKTAVSSTATGFGRLATWRCCRAHRLAERWD